MNTRKVFGYGLFAVLLTLAFTACEQPADSSTGKILTGITLNTDSVKKTYVQNETLNLADLVVTAAYSDGSKAAVANYTADPASGTTLSAIETKTVTVSYTEEAVTKTANFSVTVAAKALSGITAEYTGTTHVYPFTPLDSLKDHLAVTAQYNDNTSATLDAEDYELSGTLTAGTSTITASYTEGGVTKTATFTVTVTAATLDSIAVALNQNAAVIYTSTPRDNLKQYLTVTATYTFTGSQETHEETLSAHEYTLSGDLTAGTPTITVNYGGKTGNFTPTVTAVVLDSITAVYNGGNVEINSDVDDLKTALTVTAHYNDDSEQTASNYTLSGDVTAIGQKPITASYTDGGVTKTGTFTVTVVCTIHNWSNWTPFTSATCTTAGSEIETCSLCGITGETTRQTSIDPNAHDYQQRSTATETEDGEEGIICTHDPSHKQGSTTIAYATGTAGLAYDLINVNGNAAYRVSRGTATGAIHIPAYYRPNASSQYLLVTTISNGTDSNESTAFGGMSTSPNTTVTSVTFAANSQLKTISNNAFRQCANLTSITLPASVTSIGWYVFADCTSLASITIPEGVTSIDSSTFIRCTSLASITLPASVTSIGYGAFHGCTSLTSITIPASVTSIGDMAFYECTSLASITIPAGVTSISSNMFTSCTSLTSITLPAGVTSIGGWAFYNCTSLASITIPASVTSIGDMAFYECTSLASITIPEGVTSIGTYAFRNCTSLANIIIPASVTSIGNNAFHGCTDLTSITIPEGVTSIGNQAFYNCTSLTSITIPAGVTSISNSAFNKCTGLTSVTISEGITSISNAAFYECTSLTSITIPASVISIVDMAFYECSSLTSVTFAGTIASGSFGSTYTFPGDLRTKFYATDSADGTPGTYIVTSGTGSNKVWTRQP